MPDDYGDLGDELSRLSRRLTEDRAGFAATVLSGDCEPLDYRGFCARIQQIDDTIELIGQIRRGEDRKRPKRNPLPNVEM